MTPQDAVPDRRSGFQIGDRVRHATSGWAGPVTHVGALITVRPTHPRPKLVLDESLGEFIPTPDDWGGWAPITVTPEELERS